MDQQELLSLPKRRPARHFSVDDKKLILNIFKFCKEQNPNNNKTENTVFTANAVGISVKSVNNILREYRKAQALQQPKVYSRKRAILDNINNETKCKITRLVHSFSKRNEPLTLDKLLVAVHKDKELAFFKRTTLSLLLVELGFRYCKKTRNFVLKEMDSELNIKEEIKDSLQSLGEYVQSTVGDDNIDIKEEIEMNNQELFIKREQGVDKKLNIKEEMEDSLQSFEEYDQRLVDDVVAIKEDFQTSNQKLLMKREQGVASELNIEEEMQDSLQSFDEHMEKPIIFDTVYIKEEFIADSEDHEFYMKRINELASNIEQHTVSKSSCGDDNQPIV